MEDYSWVSGIDDDIEHIKKLRSGGFGEIHEVCRTSLLR